MRRKKCDVRATKRTDYHEQKTTRRSRQVRGGRAAKPLHFINTLRGTKAATDTTCGSSVKTKWLPPKRNSLLSSFFFSRPDPKILKTSREAEVTCVESAQAFHSRRQPFISSSISIYLRSHRCACDAHPYFRRSARRSTQTARKVKRAARILD